MITSLPSLSSVALVAALSGLTLAAPTGAAVAQEAESAAPDIVEMTLGSEDAPVTVIEYASFTCPHCATFHENVFPEIKTNYIDTGKVKFVYREVYFGEDPRPSLWPGIVARCGGDTRYFGIVDMVFDRQSDWARATTAQDMVDQLRTIGRTAGLSDEQMDACFSDGPKAQAMYDTFVENMEADGVNATPSFVINGEKYSNMSYANFAEVLDEKLGE
ncbi:MAG: DsbA family protein [Pseudomonadota bacterium]